MHSIIDKKKGLFTALDRRWTQNSKWTTTMTMDQEVRTVQDYARQLQGIPHLSPQQEHKKRDVFCFSGDPKNWSCRRGVRDARLLKIFVMFLTTGSVPAWVPYMQYENLVDTSEDARKVNHDWKVRGQTMNRILQLHCWTYTPIKQLECLIECLIAVRMLTVELRAMHFSYRKILGKKKK